MEAIEIMLLSPKHNLLYSVEKDSAVMLHLAKKVFSIATTISQIHWPT